jgi:hypothetical protein
METPTSQSNGIGKLLPKSIAAKRRRNKSSSTAETTSISDDVASQQGGITSRSTFGSDTNSLNGSLKSNNTDPAAIDDFDRES